MKLVKVNRSDLGHHGASNDNCLGREWDRVGPTFRDVALFKHTAPPPRRDRFRGAKFNAR